MTTGLYINYNGITLSPTPLINYSQVPTNYGYIFGYQCDISLDGLYSGITTTGNTINFLTGTFANQFGVLTVTDNIGNTLYQWSGITVNSISLESNPYFSGSFVKYSIKLTSFEFPSGVIDPSNEYAFTQNEDGTVNVNHKISARGIRNSTYAFNNAITFVQQFTGKDPYGYCLPYLVPQGSGVLLSLSENINRAESIYTVNEIYKYNTGTVQPYVSIDSLDINDSIDAEYRVIDYTLKIQGSPIWKNTSSIINNDLDYYVLTNIQNEFGFNTSSWVKNTYSASIDSGAALIDIKIQYLSGANLNGFLDYELTCNIDNLTAIENWKLDGEFRCFGPLEYKSGQMQVFKSQNNSNNWRTYLTGIIINSPIYAQIHNPTVVFSPNCKVDITENTELAQLKLSLILEAGYEPLGVDDLKYTIDASPGKWIYELIPSANIEGAYVIQNLQTQSRPRQKYSLESRTYNITGALNDLKGYISNIANTYVISGTQNNVTAFLTDYDYSTGVYEVSVSTSWVGQDSGITTGVLSLQSIGTNTFTVPTRAPSYIFGY